MGRLLITIRLRDPSGCIFDSIRARSNVASPAEALATLSPDFASDLTTRERGGSCKRVRRVVRFATQRSTVGLYARNFDAVGRYREKEREKDHARGSYEPRLGGGISFAGHAELANIWSIVKIPESVCQQSVSDFVKQRWRPYGPSGSIRGAKVSRVQFQRAAVAGEIAVAGSLE